MSAPDPAPFLLRPGRDEYEVEVSEPAPARRWRGDSIESEPEDDEDTEEEEVDRRLDFERDGFPLGDPAASRPLPMGDPSRRSPIEARPEGDRPLIPRLSLSTSSAAIEAPREEGCRNTLTANQATTLGAQRRAQRPT